MFRIRPSAGVGKVRSTPNIATNMASEVKITNRIVGIKFETIKTENPIAIVVPYCTNYSTPGFNA